MMKYTKVTTILLIVALTLAGCANESTWRRDGASALSSDQHQLSSPNQISAAFDVFPFNEDAPPDIPSASEVCTARKELRTFQPSILVSKSTQGEMVINGVLMTARALPRQKQELSIEVDDILFGDVRHLPKRITVISPMEQFGGIPVVIGEKYRALILNVRGKYYSWASTGSAPSNPRFVGFYPCDDKSQ
jgi:hypothetical protein